MKKLALISLALILAISCKKEEAGFEITANLTGFKPNETVFINKLTNTNKTVVLDSTQLKDGKFNIRLPKVEEKDFNFITFSETKGNILVIAENNSITINADQSDLRRAEIIGSKENIIFSEYLKKIVEQNALEVNLKNEQRQATKTGDFSEVKFLGEQINELTDSKKQMRMGMMNNHPESIVSVMALSDLLNFKMLKPKEAKVLFNKMDKSLQESRIGKNLKNNLDALASLTASIGDKPEDFSGPTPSGETLSLKSVMGKLTIIDFWASWCRPCRMENPNVVNVYKKYHDKGLEIIGVSLDKSADKWKAAIEKDGLIWNHVSNLKSWQEPIAKPFGVRSIPATFLLDENGVIIAKDLRGQDLELKVKEILGE